MGEYNFESFYKKRKTLFSLGTIHLCLVCIVRRLGAGDETKFDDALVESSQHEKHGIGTSQCRKSGFQDSNHISQVQATLDDGLPKRSNNVGPIFSSHVRGTLCFHYNEKNGRKIIKM